MSFLFIESEVILAKQRIGEISGATKITNALFCRSTRNQIPSKLCITPVNEQISNISWFRMSWVKLNSWLDDENVTKLCKVRKHVTTENEECMEISSKKYQFSYDWRLAGLTEKMMKEKADRQSEIIKTIKETQKQTNKQIEDLLVNEENVVLQTCQRFIQDGYTFESIALRSPNGELKKIEGKIYDQIEK